MSWTLSSWISLGVSSNYFEKMLIVKQISKYCLFYYFWFEMSSEDELKYGKRTSKSSIFVVFFSFLCVEINFDDVTLPRHYRSRWERCIMYRMLRSWSIESIKSKETIISRLEIDESKTIVFHCDCWPSYFDQYFVFDIDIDIKAHPLNF